MKLKESHLFMHVETNRISSALGRVDPQTYDTVVYDTEQISGDFRRFEAVWPIVRRLLDKSLRSHHCRAVLSFHAGFCSTLQTAFVVRRDHPQAAIDEAELESMISSALWHLFNKNRGRLAQKMGVPDSQVTLVNAAIIGVRIDGHKVASPIGFTGRTIELTVLYGALPRLLYEAFAPLLSSEFEIFISELGVAETKHMAQQHGTAPFLFMRVADTATYVYGMADGEAGYRDTIQWGADSLSGALAELLQISGPGATEIIRRSREQLVSAHVERRVAALLAEELAILLKGIGAHVEGGRYATVYVAAPFTVPQDLLSPHLAQAAGLASRVVLVDEEQRGKKNDFGLPLEKIGADISLFSLVSGAKLAEQLGGASELTKIARRRARWLAGAPLKSVKTDSFHYDHG